jgi:hypothetical protein
MFHGHSEANVVSPAAPLLDGSSRSLPTSGSARDVSLRGRLLAVRRRRLAVRVRDWVGIGVIAAFSVTLFAVTFFSLFGR